MVARMAVLEVDKQIIYPSNLIISDNQSNPEFASQNFDFSRG
jgi:hypothetical protein